LTAAAYQRQLDPPSHAEPPVHRNRGLKVYFLALAFAACELAGMATLVLAYSIAQTTRSNVPEFAWFWFGMFLLGFPIVGLIARRATPQAMRTALIVLYGLVTYIPKLLRNPSSPIYHDEFAHWRATHEILSTGKLFQPNPIISIIARYPGLHATTAALVQATDLTIWQAATLLLIFFHVALVLGVAALAQGLGMSSRTASVIAILYGLNSSFLYFDTQYAYESMALTLVVWTLVTYVHAIRSQRGRGRLAWSGLTVLLSAATVVTHHLSTFTLVVIMALLSLAVSMPWLAKTKDGPPEGWLAGRLSDGRSTGSAEGWPEGWVRYGRAGGDGLERRAGEGWVRTVVTAWGLTLMAALMAGVWFRFAAPTTWTYLSPFLGEGFSELVQVVSGSGTARQLFGASLSPWWEQKSAYLVPVFALAATVGGLLFLIARIRDGGLPRGCRRALLLGFALLGLVYFPSTVFILAPSGSEGARRSWAFTWIGLCILTGPAIVWLMEWARHRAHQWLRISLYSGLWVALAITQVGGTAAGVDASYRFPGPFLYGSDARSVTPELLAVSRWFSGRLGLENNIVTDRYTGLIFGSLGLQNPASPSVGFPVYNLYLTKPGALIKPAALLFDLGNSNYTYLIVDRYMAYDLPETGMYFIPGEPGVLDRLQGGKPVFYGRLGKFNSFKWMVKIFQSDHYSIFKLNLPETKIGYQPRSPKLHGKSLQGKLTVTS
jgi:hypothetical protein